MERAEEVAMLYGLEALAEMTSGPTELLEYHALVQRAEANSVTVEEQEFIEQQTQRRLASMADETAAPEVHPAPRRKRSPNKPKVAEHGAISIKLELSASDAEALLGFLIRTGLTQAAHQTVDAISKAAKNGY